MGGDITDFFNTITGGGDDQPQQSPFEQDLSRIANELFASTGGVRSNLLEQLLSATEGTFDPTTSPTFQPIFNLAREGVESQFGRAKENIISSTPRGGTQQGALAELETDRAVQAGSLPSQISGNIIQDMLNKAFGAAFNAPGAALTGLSAAASSFGPKQASFMQTQAGRQDQFASDLGSKIGNAVGAAGPGGGGK